MSCTDDDQNIWQQPLDVGCPCDGCEGILRSDGRNGFNTKTFLECNQCGHTYQALDSANVTTMPEQEQVEPDDYEVIDKTIPCLHCNAALARMRVGEDGKTRCTSCGVSTDGDCLCPRDPMTVQHAFTCPLFVETF